MSMLYKMAPVTLLAWLCMPVTMAAEPARILNAWVRATVPGQSVAGAYLDIIASAPAALIAVESGVAGKGELHMMSMDGGVMKMRPAGRIELPANQTVSLKPGGYHVMLMDIKRQLNAGERVPLTLTLQDRYGVKSTLEVNAEVRVAAEASPHVK